MNQTRLAASTDQELLDELCRRLARAPIVKKSKYRDGNYETAGERISARYARQLAFDLLDAAKSDGQGGCPLCKS